MFIQATPVSAESGRETARTSDSSSEINSRRDNGAAGAPSCVLPCSASQIPIANFERVNSVLLRGAVPSDKGLEALRDAGVKTIVNLQLKGDGATNEQLKVKKLGMNYVHFPLGFSTPDTATIGRILRVMTDKEKQPVFVHCRQGADRTGMIVAIYRILVDNWEFKDAYAEMRKHHFKPFLLVLKEAVRTCNAQGELLAAVGIDRGDNNKRLVGSLEIKPEAAGQ
jgi:Protein tyrosine/serine phosphatase